MWRLAPRSVSGAGKAQNTRNMTPTTDEIHMILHGGKIDAIKMLRCFYDCSLREGKIMVEKIRNGEVKLSDLIGSPKKPCSHCNGTGYMDA